MSRNEERLGTQHLGAESPAPNLEMQASGMEWMTTTEFVDLPTKGKFYPPGHPLHMKETCEIKLMAAPQEDILNNKSYLKKGIAIDKLIQSLLVDKSIKVDSLFSGDKNAIIMAARISGFGEDYEAHVLCPICQEKVKFKFNLEEIKTKFADEELKLSDNNTFFITVPKTKVRVECRLLTGADEKYLVKESEMRKSKGLEPTPIVSLMRQFIVSINDSNDATTISKFLMYAPSGDTRHLRNEYQKMVPNLDMQQYFECSECGAGSEVTVPLNAAFFWDQ